MKKTFRLIKRFPQTVFTLLLSLSASAYVVVIYLIKEEITFSFFPAKFDCISYIFYLIIPIVIARICVWLSKYLSKCEMGCQITKVELASHSFLPNYLGYFLLH